MDFDDIVREFLVESYENLDRLDQALVALETRPADSALLADIFRTIHTLKGTAGFLGFTKLEAISRPRHHAPHQDSADARDHPGAEVATGVERFAIPQVSLLELVRLEGDQITVTRRSACEPSLWRNRATCTSTVRAPSS
jgi:two-component system, chemotaxis family, sensor kinase CheA